MSDEVETPDDAAPVARGPIPYERFAAVNAEKRAATREAESLRARVAALEAEVGTHRTAAEQAAASLAAAEDRFALHRAGVTDDDGAEVARMLYGRIAPDARPKGGLTEWIDGLRATPDAIPRPLQPYLSASPAPTGQAGSTPAATPPPRRPAENVGVTGRAPDVADPAAMSAEQIRAYVQGFRSRGELHKLAQDPLYQRLRGGR